MTTGLKIQRTLPLAKLDSDLAYFFREDGDVAVALRPDEWRVADQPTVITVTVEKIR